MEYNNIYRSPNELTHWGIKGMKWGVRRYQNKDGSLTAAGKKRRAQLEGELEKLGGKNDPSDSAASVRQKTISEMSNKELQEYTTRMQLEKNYYDAQRQLASANPKQVSAGRKIAEKFINEAVIPATTNAGRAYIEKMMKEKMGINTEDPVAALEKTWKKLDFEQKIDKIKNPDKYMSEEDKNKRQQREYNAEDRAAQKEGYANAAAKAKAERDAREKAEKEAKNKANTEPSAESHSSSGSDSNNGRNETASAGQSQRGRDTVNDYSDAPVTSISLVNAERGKRRVDSILDRDGNEIFSFDFDSYSGYQRDDD